MSNVTHLAVPVSVIRETLASCYAQAIIAGQRGMLNPVMADLSQNLVVGVGRQLGRDCVKRGLFSEEASHKLFRDGMDELVHAKLEEIAAVMAGQQVGHA